MVVLKCKMCGGQLNVDDETVVECEYCGTKQTVPTLDDEKKVSLFTRANKLRLACDFDKAYSVYESIVAEFEEEAEAYWGLVLCKYGIEYVDDPATGKKVPTCHRTSFDSVMKDHNFEMVMENADSVAIRVYREEAKVIEEIRKGIIEVSSKEEPYDIFICYKETAEDGQRTIDSVLAQDIYTELTEKGYKVFFSRITLEDKLGQEYEPYIFSALNSAKVMLVFGTDYMHFNSVWVKNEWSRFLKLIANGQKKTLIPCYKDIDAYDMPEEFNKLQAQDLGKVGATQDLLRGIEKIIPLKKEENSDYSQSLNKVDSLIERAETLLLEEEFSKAINFATKVLSIDPHNSSALLINLLAQNQFTKVEDFASLDRFYFYKSALESDAYVQFMRCGNDDDKENVLNIIDEQDKKYCKRLEENVNKHLESGNYEEALKEVDYYRVCSNYESLKSKVEKEKAKYLIIEEKDLANKNEIKKSRQEIVKNKTFRSKYRLVNNMISYCAAKGSKGYDAVAVTENGNILFEFSPYTNDLLYKKAKKTWNNIVQCIFLSQSIVALKDDGTVHYVGNEPFDYVDIKDTKTWTNIKQIVSFEKGIIGLKNDGTLVSSLTGENFILDDIKDVHCLLLGDNHYSKHVYVLHSDKTITHIYYDSFYGKNGKFTKSKETFNEDLIEITRGITQDKDTEFAIINSNGEIFIDEKYGYDYSNINDDGGVVFCKFINGVPVAITYDNKLVFGKEYDAKTNELKTTRDEEVITDLINRSNIEEIVGVGGLNGYRYVISKDGTVYGSLEHGRALFEGQKLFSNFDNILDNCIFSDEYKAIKKKEQEEKEMLMASYREKGLCQYCGGEFKKSFLGTKCTSCGKSKDY